MPSKVDIISANGADLGYNWIIFKWYNLLFLRGTALIVNFEKFSNITYKNRQGSRVDEQNLSDLFREFGKGHPII